MAIRGVLLDLSGVVYEGDAALPGAVEAVGRLRGAGLPVRFLTNTTRRPRHVILAHIASLGLPVTAAELLTPASAACDRLRAEGRAPHLLVHPDLEEDFTGLPAGAAEAVVVGDAGERFTYDRMNAAFRAIDAGALFLALARNRVFKDADGSLSLDAGAFVAALEYATGTQAQLLGKPAAAFFAAAAASMGCALDDVAMVGDDAEADVGGARAAGVGAAYLVRTGKFRAGDETSVDFAPTAVADDLAAAAGMILAAQSGAD